MFRALIVEDDDAKAEAVISTLLAAGIQSGEAVRVSAVQEAKAWLRDHRCELLILDLNIPSRLGEAPRFNGGLELLDEVSTRDRYHKPEHVIGLTQFEEVLRSSAPVFEQALIPIIMYDQGGDWRKKIAKRVQYLIETRIPVESKADYDFDVAIITALEQPELQAVLKLPWKWGEIGREEDDIRYFKGSAQGVTSSANVIAAASPLVGMSAAACLATKMIHFFRPRYLIHLGIAAGIEGRVNLGDVLVADPSWDWGSGKLAIKDGRPVFYAAPYQFPLREEMRGRVRRLAADELELARIRSEWVGRKPTTTLEVKLGPVASGAAVLSDKDTARHVEEQHRKLIGIEMETYGVFAAGEYCPRPRPLTLSMKSVCDFADPNKSDDFQAYAAYTSARAFQLLLEKYILA